MGVVGGGLWHMAPRAGLEHVYIGGGSGGLGLGNPIVKKVVFSYVLRMWLKWFQSVFVFVYI